MKALRVLAGTYLTSAMILGFCPPARGQTCHTPSFRDPSEGGFHVGLRHVFATFSESGDRGSYQGLIPALTWSHPWVTAELAVPAYRLERGGEEAIGLGDLTATGRVAVFRTDGGDFAFGPELAVMFPTGDRDRDLGMGHVMLMPGAWLRLDVRDFSLLAQLGYGGALSSSDHAHHHEEGDAHVAVASPRVNPMNASELEHALGIRYAVDPQLSFTARWVGAVPLDDDGLPRQLIGPGITLEGDPLDAAFELLVPVAGEPFDFRLSIVMGAQL